MASQSTWQTMSASECPSRPAAAGTSTPPSTSRPPAHQPVRVERRADALLSQAAPPRARGRGTAPATCSPPRAPSRRQRSRPMPTSSGRCASDASVIGTSAARSSSSQISDGYTSPAAFRSPALEISAHTPPAAERLRRLRAELALQLLGRPVAEHLRQVGMRHHVVDPARPRPRTPRRRTAATPARPGACPRSSSRDGRTPPHRASAPSRGRRRTAARRRPPRRRRRPAGRASRARARPGSAGRRRAPRPGARRRGRGRPGRSRARRCGRTAAPPRGSGRRAP